VAGEDLRLVSLWDEENQREIQLLTNLMHLSAATIGAIYKERWQIELFFKALKQSLKIKTFRGHQPKRGAHPDLDSINSNAAYQNIAAAKYLWMGAEQPGGAAALEPLHVPLLMGVD
jgi:Transposase DDE domain